MTTLGERLRIEREKLGSTQHYFGALGGISQQGQANYEADRRKPDTDYLGAIAHVADVQYIITGVRSHNTPSQWEIAVALARNFEDDLKEAKRIAEARKTTKRDDSAPPITLVQHVRTAAEQAFKVVMSSGISVTPEQFAQMLMALLPATPKHELPDGTIVFSVEPDRDSDE
ncbi:MAG: helix-turn-helix domain-containing protein [Burkholderiaceae bacterium]|jgi:transcriptional regulator with XRE-family HTH domain|nr:helix-turn-helix domain-containing protein [Burkholderiaceae bacterium]